MLCPECNHQLAPIALTTKTGVVTLDYCPNCGGVWSDSGEVNFLKRRDLTPLIHLLPKHSDHPSIYSLPCPRDRNTLHITKAESIPANVDIFRCGSCGGLWFPEDALVDFKKAQEYKLAYFKTWQIPLHSIYAVLLPLLFIAVIGGGLIATLSGVNDSRELRTRAQDVISTPLVLYPGQQEVLIHFTTQKAMIVKINYWTNPNEVHEMWSSTTAKTDHTLLLKNLELNLNYSYQIVTSAPEVVTSPIYTFNTKEQSGK